jgi:hypothetical protein
MALGTSDPIDKRLRSKAFSAGPSTSVRSTGAHNFYPGFHRGEKDAYI